MLVGIGAGVTVEKSTEEAISFLRDRITEMDASGKRLSESLGKLQSQMAAVEQRMQEIYASAQQQNRGHFLFYSFSVYFLIGPFIFVWRFSQMQIHEIPVSVMEEYSSII